jgi:hypothetical protein
MYDKNTKKSWRAAFVAVAMSVTVLGGTAAAQGPFVDSGTVADTYAGPVWADLPGAVVWADVPPGTSRLILAHFSAESACYGTPAGYCSVRILINGAEGAPASNTDFAFDSNDGGTETYGSWESHSVQRYRWVYNPSLETTLWVPIVVQRYTTDNAIYLRLDDWTLSAVRSHP